MSSQGPSAKSEHFHWCWACRAKSTRSSVSGRGINTSGVITSEKSLQYAICVRCCSGTLSCSLRCHRKPSSERDSRTFTFPVWLCDVLRTLSVRFRWFASSILSCTSQSISSNKFFRPGLSTCWNPVVVAWWACSRAQTRQFWMFSIVSSCTAENSTYGVGILVGTTFRTLESRRVDTPRKMPLKMETVRETVTCLAKFITAVMWAHRSSCIFLYLLEDLHRDSAAAIKWWLKHGRVIYLTACLPLTRRAVPNSRQG